ncbi:MAG: hypothetical protein IJM72_04035, partial [Deltaproteobacteria bacterium]|nr:hypothetical protein [Deltaproteobacteria bacterium]
MEKTGRVFRALLSVFLAFLCAAQCAVCGATVLPDYDSVFGVEMPSLRHTALKDPVSEETLAD